MTAFSSFSKDLERNYYSQQWPTEALPYAHLTPYLRCWLDPDETFRDKIVLDLGAGECTYTRLIAEHFKPKLIIACDLFGERMLPAARANSSPNLEFISGDCFRLPVRNESCDVVWGSLVLHQLPELAGAAREIHRVLKKHGTYVGFEPNPYNPVILSRFLFKRHSPNQYLLTPRHLKAFRQEDFDVQTTFFYARFPGLRNRFITTCLGIRATKSVSNGKRREG